MDNTSLSPEQIKQMIVMLQGMLGQNASQQDTETTSPIATKPSRKIATNKSFVNKFDSMAESKLHKDDLAIDQALSVHSPTPRSRTFDPINVHCRVCGKKEQINPSMLSDSPSRYKCNDCARNPG